MADHPEVSEEMRIFQDYLRRIIALQNGVQQKI